MKTFPFGSVTAISLFAPSVKSRLKQLKLFSTIWQLNNACRNSHFNGPTKVKKALLGVEVECSTLLFFVNTIFLKTLRNSTNCCKNHSCFQSSVKSVYLIQGPFVLFAQRAALNTYRPSH